MMDMSMWLLRGSFPVQMSRGITSHEILGGSIISATTPSHLLRVLIIQHLGTNAHVTMNTNRNRIYILCIMTEKASESLSRLYSE